MIYLDSCLLIYAVEQPAGLGGRVLARMSTSPLEIFVVSALTRLECLVGPIRSANLALENHYLSVFSQLRLLPVDDAVWRSATAIRARHLLKTPDAIHLACAQHHRCHALWTNDNRLSRCATGFAVNILG